MENNELQKIWKKVDTEINQKSKDELNLLLMSKTRQTINKLLFVQIISILVSAGMLFFLTITSLNRQNDLIYLVNNISLGIITLTALGSGLWSWYKISNNRFNQPMKVWLKEKTDILARWLTGKTSKLYIFIIPLIYLLTILSIHVYFENKPFLEVLKNEESVTGLIVAMPVGLFVSYFAVRKIRKYQLNKLEVLKDLYARICTGD